MKPAQKKEESPRLAEEIQAKAPGSANDSRLPITKYGNIDITNSVPSGLVHVDLPRLGPTCKRLGIEYGKAVVDWSEVGHKHHPVLSGVVIRQGDKEKLLHAIAEKGKKHQQKVDRLSVLAALFTLNRRAKRCRDLTQTYYRGRMHGLAGGMKREKERIYDIKGQVLHHMVEAGVLIGGKFHRFEFGNWAEILAGGGYTFHRPCPPQKEANGETETVASIEAKPKGAKEPTLAVAYQVIENFLEGKSRASVYQWPRINRGRRNCRQEEDEHEAEIDSLEDAEDDDDGQELPSGNKNHTKE